MWKDNDHKVGFDYSSIYIKDKIIGRTMLQVSNDGGVYVLSSSQLASALVVVRAPGDV